MARKTQNIINHENDNVAIENLPKVKKGFHIDEKGNEVPDINENVVQEVKGTITFIDGDGNDTLINFSDIKKTEKEIKNNAFKSFVNQTSFHEACESGKWNQPYIGLHEKDERSDSEYLTVFTKETGINFKRFITEKYGKDELKVLSEKYRKEIRICNAFLNHIAIDGEKVNVDDVKKALNELNESELHIKLSCVDDNDNEYTLSCTNKMVRVSLVDMAKANIDISGFKTVKITDMISVIVSGLSKVYHARNDQ